MATPPEDVRKMGYLKKLKTMRSKLFVLREGTSSDGARLEYYDNDKKFKKGVPKRSIQLHSCFSINRKSDCRQRFAIALYTKDDCFSVVCDTEDDREEWLKAMLELRSGEENEPQPVFEHLWPVNVRMKGLSSTGGTISPGAYRLCLTTTELKLVRVGLEQLEINFQLASIRRCGHTECFFFMEIGRSARTGEGELWMQVEDATIAKSMHEVIRCAMKSSKLEQEPPPSLHSGRNRSHSSVEARHRPRHSKTGPSRQSSMHSSSSTYDSATLPLTRPKPQSASNIDLPRSPLSRRHSHSPSKAVLSAAPGGSLSLAHSPLSETGGYPLSLLPGDSHRTRTDSMESRGSRCTTSSLSAEEMDVVQFDHLPSSGGGSTRSVTPDGPIEEEPNSYLSMTPGGSSKWARDSLSSSVDSNTQSYFSMTPGTTPGTTPNATSGVMTPGSGHSTPGSRASATGGSSYMEMSPGLPATPPADSGYMNMSQTSGSASSTTSSSHDMEDGSYLDMKPCSQSLPKSQNTLEVDGGYLDMSPLAYGIQRAGSTSSSSSLRPDKVCSFLLEEDAQDGPRRAYSVGSKPMALLAKPHLDVFNDNPSIESAQSKSCSAPHLPDKDKLRRPPPSTDAHTDDRFMELDFQDRRDDEEFRCRTYSGGSRDFRPRTSSGGCKDFRAPTSSFGPCERMRAGSFGGRDAIPKPEGHRQRTSTICQDSLRPRTSSFGQVENMRPRSSSYGNARFRELRKLGKESHRSSSNEALRKGCSRTPSQDSLKRSQRMIGNDLKRMTAQLTGNEYMDMTKGSSGSLSSTDKDYVHMSNPAPSSSPAPTTSRLVSFNIQNQGTDDYAFIQPGGPSSPVAPAPAPVSTVAAAAASSASTFTTTSMSIPTAEGGKASDYCIMEAVDKDYMMMGEDKEKVKPGGATSPPASQRLSNPIPVTREKTPVLQGSPKISTHHSQKMAPAARSAGKSTSTMHKVPEEASGEYVELGFAPKVRDPTPTSAGTKAKQSQLAAPKTRPVPMPATSNKQQVIQDNSYVMYSPAVETSSSPAPEKGKLEKVRSPLSLEPSTSESSSIKPAPSPFPELGRVSPSLPTTNGDSYTNMDFSRKPLTIDVSESRKVLSIRIPGQKKPPSPGGIAVARSPDKLHSPGGATRKSGSSPDGINKQVSPGGTTRQGGILKPQSPRGSGSSFKQNSPGGGNAAAEKQHSPGGITLVLGPQHSPGKVVPGSTVDTSRNCVKYSMGAPLSPPQEHPKESSDSVEGDYMQLGLAPPVAASANNGLRKHSNPPVAKVPGAKLSTPEKERRSSTGSFGSCSSSSSPAKPAKPPSTTQNTLNVWPQGSRMPSRGSTGSLATLSERQNSSKMTSRGSVGSLTSMDAQKQPTASAQQQQQQPTEQLNYATLELTTGSTQPPPPPPPGGSTTVTPQEAPMQYAQIDFSKSCEAVPVSKKNSGIKENRLSFS